MSSKDPAYRDTMYVEELIGPETIATMPEATIQAFQDHGVPERRLEAGVDEARELLGELRTVGLDYDDVVATLEREGIEKFVASFDALLRHVEGKRETVGSVA